MEGGGKKKQQSSGSVGSGDGAGAAREQRPVGIVDELSVRKDKGAAVDASSDIHPDDATRVMERQRSRRSIPARFRPPAPRQYDVSKKQSTNREVVEDGSRNSSIGSEESVISDSTYLTSSVNYGGRDYHTSSAPAASPREPTIDELFSGDANPDVAYRGDWWRGGLYY